MHKDKNLSKWFKLFISGRLLNTLRYRTREVIKWSKQRDYKNIKHKDGKTFREHSALVRDYYRGVIEQAIKHPGITEVLYIGTVSIQEVKRFNGSSRPIPNEEGGFNQVIEDPFLNYTHYLYVFSPMYTKIKAEIRPLIQSAVPISMVRRYVKLAYKLHPRGNFYNLKK